MIFYSPAPLELLEGADFENIVTIQLSSGGYIKATPLEYNQLRVLDLVSTDPMDYMDDRLQPGMVISLKPSF